MALALAEELRQRDPQTAILFVGTKRGLESRVLPALGFQLETIAIGGFKKVGLRKAIKTLCQLPLSFFRSKQIIQQFGPSILVGVGGYSSGPLVLAGKFLGLPCLVLEPNVHPGLTNRLLRRWVDGVAVSFEETAAWFGKKARLTGIPTRKQFHRIEARTSSHEPLCVLILGGSQGSRSINRMVCEALPFLSTERVTIIHQTGPSDYLQVKKQYRESEFRAREIIEFIDDMPAYFHCADLIVSRAGALTVAEIAAAGRPALLVPFPHAPDDHQRKNAQVLAHRAAALVLEQEQTSGHDLARVLLELAKDRGRLQRMGLASRTLAQPHSTSRIIEMMEELTHQGKPQTGGRNRHNPPASPLRSPSNADEWR